MSMHGLASITSQVSDEGEKTDAGEMDILARVHNYWMSISDFHDARLRRWNTGLMLHAVRPAMLTLCRILRYFHSAMSCLDRQRVSRFVYVHTTLSTGSILEPLAFLFSGTVEPTGLACPLLHGQTLIHRSIIRNACYLPSSVTTYQSP